MADSSIVIEAELGDYFRGQIDEACRALNAPIDDAARFYLVTLCHDFGRVGSHAPKLGSEPLALMHHRARELPRVDKMLLLKDLGDVALYTSGFFSESIARSWVDVPYYVTMGSTAYQELHCLTDAGPRSGGVGNLYRDLAKHFVTCVDVLSFVRAGKQMDTENIDLLRLYERWTKTGSDKDHRALVARGFVPEALHGASAQFQ